MPKYSGLYATIITILTIAIIGWLWAFSITAPKIQTCMFLGGDYNVFLGTCYDKNEKEIRMK